MACGRSRFRNTEPEIDSFSLSRLAWPPVSKLILPAACLANCFLGSQGMEMLQPPPLLSVPEPFLFALRSSCFLRMAVGGIGPERVAEGRQDKQNKSG